MVGSKLRPALLLALAGLASLALAPAAASQKPTKEPVVQPPDEVIEGVCPFPVLVETVVNKGSSSPSRTGRCFSRARSRYG